MLTSYEEKVTKYWKNPEKSPEEKKPENKIESTKKKLNKEKLSRKGSRAAIALSPSRVTHINISQEGPTSINYEKGPKKKMASNSRNSMFVSHQIRRERRKTKKQKKME